MYVPLSLSLSLFVPFITHFLLSFGARDMRAQADKRSSSPTPKSPPTPRNSSAISGGNNGLA
jgi:hypothetical protein